MDAHLEAVLSTAEVVLTLTPGAADEIAARFGRTAIVVAHPSVAAARSGARVPSGGWSGCGWGRRRRRCPTRRSWCGRRCRARCPAAAGCGCWSTPSTCWTRPAVRELAAAGERGAGRAPAERLGGGAAAAARRGAAGARADATRATWRSAGTSAPASSRPAAAGCADQWSDVVSYGNHENGGLDPVSLSAAVSAALTRPMLRPADGAWRDGAADGRAAGARRRLRPGGRRPELGLTPGSGPPLTAELRRCGRRSHPPRGGRFDDRGGPGVESAQPMATRSCGSGPAPRRSPGRPSHGRRPRPPGPRAAGSGRRGGVPAAAPHATRAAWSWSC